ncbi:MAG: hypothetical protein IIA53_10545, partial [Chloroflexi bacterium]|nr:hypothetical protein [Chloroflexota bacterium]
MAFRDAEEMNESSSEQRYLGASNFLRDAERRGLPPARRPIWAFALGKSLQSIGLADEARPILRQAVETYKPGKVEASMLLMEIYLDLMEPQVLEEALRFNTELTEMKQKIDREQMDQIYLLRAQILLALDRSMAAEEALAHVSNKTSSNLGT